MALIKCSKCGKAISSTSPTCVACESPFARYSKKDTDKVRGKQRNLSDNIVWMATFIGAIVSLYMSIKFESLVVGLSFFVLMLLAIGGLCVIFSTEPPKSKKILENRENWKTINSVVHEHSFKYKNSTQDLEFVFDEKHNKLIVFNLDKEPLIVLFCDIIGCEIRDNGEVAGGVGRALLGGVLAGGAGAIVGATTAKQKIISYQIIILCDNLITPEIVVDILTKNMEVKRNSDSFTKASKFGNEINSAIKVILNRQK